VIDGLKIVCEGLDPMHWENNGLLQFKTDIELATGEILNNGDKVAFYNGLQFIIKPSSKSALPVCMVRGSIAKYYAKGETNAFDFTLSKLNEAIISLHRIFNIDPTKAKLQGFEYGLNIKIPIDPKKFLRGLIAYKSRGFSIMNSKDSSIGRIIDYKKFRALKVYNKSKQDKEAPDHLIRIEEKFYRMSPVSKYGIVWLADLPTPKIIPLAFSTLEFWGNCIFSIEKPTYKAMTDFERKKWLYYLTPKHWEEVEKKQRYRMKRHFQELKQKYTTDNLQHEIYKTMETKLKDLTADKGLKNVHLLHGVKCENESQKQIGKCPPFTPLDEGVKSTPNDKQNINKSINKKCAKIDRKKCKVCRAKIDHKKAGALYCSKHCNNSFHAKRRTNQRRQKIRTEKQILRLLLDRLEKSNYWVLITYQFENVNYSETLRQSEIIGGFTIDCKVSKVQILHSLKSSNPKTLTSYRAKKFIKECQKLN
jgi:hypothetical protein